jgi:hypothetical protein
MKTVFKKLVFGSNPNRKIDSTGTIDKRIKNINAIWNNERIDDVGIEKIFRLFLAASQFLFPGIYIKHFFSKKGNEIKDVMIDFYVMAKVALPLSLLTYHWLPYPYSIFVVIWLLFETLLYVPSLIFASDHLPRPSSYRRSMLLLFFNYLEIVMAYAFIYSTGHYLNTEFKEWYDPIYFSFATLSTIGYGDFYPITGLGKFLVCTQSLIFLAFVVLFINFFSNKVESPGYFSKDDEQIE